MKTTIKRLIIILFCIFTIIPFFSAVHAEEGDGETRTIHSRFYVLTTKETRTLDVPFNKNWFNKDARIYSHDLCKLSIGLATAAFRPNAADEDHSTADINLRKFLSEADFVDLRSDDYEKNPGMYTVSTVMGHQRIGEGEDSYELIAVGICGQGYLDEWESNFSIGDDKIHEGFSRSAGLVYDRIFGYIASAKIKGPYKVWISGFSRAAAISNITAARLSEADDFGQANVFAYTFATPRTVITKYYDAYLNIFNIVGKADPVPQVPFADWGYERYGQTFYLPAMETDSDFEEKRVRANVVYKELTGIDYWYNRDANNLLRDILAYFIEICPSAEVYANSIQNNFIALWEDRSPVNILSRLITMANDPILITEKNRGEANMLLNYLLLFAMDWFDSNSLFSRWNKNASLGANILQAHTPELYVSWLYSAGPKELYNEQQRYVTYVFDYMNEVCLYKDGNMIESLPGTHIFDTETAEEIELIKERDRVVPDNYQYMDYIDNSVSVQLPRDMEYEIVVKSDTSQPVTWVEANYATGRQTPLSTTLRQYKMSEDEDLIIHVNPQMDDEFDTTKGMKRDELYESESDLPYSYTVLITRPQTAMVSWRDAILWAIGIATSILSLFIFQIVFVVGKLRHNHRIRLGWIPKGTKYRALPQLCVTVIFILYVLMLFDYSLFPDNKNVITVLKAEIAVLSSLIALIGFLKRRNMLSGFITIGVALLGIADAITANSILAGSLLHIAAYITLTYAYIKEEMPGFRRITTWVIMTGIGVAALMSVDGSYGFLRVIAIVYLAASAAMVISSLVLPRRVFYGSIFLFFAGMLLMYNQINGTTFFSHALSLGFYYLAIIALATANTRIIIPKLVPEMLEHEAGIEAAG